MRRYNVRLRIIEDGSPLERTVSVQASGLNDARRRIAEKYDDVLIVAVSPERFLEHRQHRYVWTQQPLDDRTYETIEFVPIGPGARGGRACRWKPTREERFRSKRAAIACAREWYDAAKAKYAPPAAETAEEYQSAVDDALLYPSLRRRRDCGGELHVDWQTDGERLLTCWGVGSGATGSDCPEQGAARGCGATFPLPQRGTLRASGKTCACGWPLIEVVPAWPDQRPWLQCADNNCIAPRDDWRL